MKKNILILNGAARKNGNTASLIQAVTWYRTYEHNLGWRNRGEILGKRKEREAYRLGASL